MIRTLLWLLAGAVLGGIIHIVVILALPIFATQDVWTRITALGAVEKAVVLPAPALGEPNPLRLDPDMAYAVCQVDLSSGPGVVSGTLPDAFWSIAVYNRAGTVIYSTTNRDGIGQNLDLGIFNPAQTRLLAQQQLDIAEGLLIVESPQNDVFAVVRLAPPHPAMKARYEKALSELECGNIKSDTN
ncbi:DUF1254 domain-containing protein [Paradevosia shaoguanensis]|uniref:DUF1254 domain-containing protein n=1 Tax=Paradevosia shaoguanensis TaxID=1335043 RepID=UPI001931959F|nr:DUF1254 domain-containing protein [Paradevosia shaoguanensis]